MDSGTSGDLAAFQELAERFAKKEILPDVLDRDYYPFAEFHEKAVEVASSIGLLGLTLPESYGGSAQGMKALAAVLEVLARTDASTAAILLCQAMARAVLIELGPEESAKKWAALDESGGAPLLAVPIYSDPDELPDSVTSATSPDGIKLVGDFDYLACLPVAKAAIVPASDDKGKIRLFLVELDAKGVKVGDPVVSLGLKGCPVADLKLGGVVVPSSAMLGGDAGAEKYAKVAERFRGPLTAIALGTLQGTYSVALDYCMERYQGKKMIVEHHMVRRKLSNMLMWIDIASPLVSHACELADSGVDCSGTELVSIQEAITSALTQATTDGVQALGGYGYMHDYGQEKRMRDAKQLQAMLGSSPTRVMKIMNRRLA